jgi:regulator of protease activity HflC (stomatin/prohibitin superfamily)
MADIVTILAIIIPVVIVVYALVLSLREVRPTEKGLIERLGRYHRFVEGGLTFLIPFVDKMIKVNTT